MSAHEFTSRAAVGLTFCLVASTTLAEVQRYEYTADAMGAVFSLVLYSDNRSRADAASTAAFEELRRLERMLSNYRSDSGWSEVNREAAARPVQVSPDLFDLLWACRSFSRASEGAFDITVGPLMKLWGFYSGSGRIAGDAEIRATLEHVGYSHVVLDPANRAVRFARVGIELDPGGIGKGYAVDRMIAVLKRNGIERALVSAAGSSIYALGAPPGAGGWQVRIRAPVKSGRDAAGLLLRDEALSTSGRSGKSFRAGGRIFGHILDPRTGYPVRGVLMVAVAAPHALEGEAWTKAFFVNGRSWSIRHAPRGYRVFFCEEQTGGAACGWLPSPE